MKTWNDLFSIEKKKDYFLELAEFVDGEYEKYTIFPKKEEIFKAYSLTPLENVKVVIIGQDPYHGENQANGLAFSCDYPILPPSLKNIYQELANDLKIRVPNKGDLSKWAKEGVLLINAILTVRKNEPLAHENKGWEEFTKAVIEYLALYKKNVVYILWGAYAQSYEQYINHQNNLILKSSHPSPLSAHRSFFGSRVFSKTNNYLKANGIKPIDWQL
ncbi:MAG TPA: uracil-DNA glycosylase [Bacilli bacterium]|jgi:uracil-DNA glycosylase|nr:uracil-DNA glycosylase [Acholeplasmataceae bacterium]HOH59128.1 uracil-DNA glycosylase [Bacilli bacterium]HPA99116.1 uracil-DNA glycosylase [Bacilli bacterium]HQO93272.1 uracil-DNA glycosylase [Bacilli bacterium]HQQ38930.1 uracil-DNA glycosylase [Bacilli bacterium]